MSLYRKYRPLDFASLLGQDHIREILQNAVKQNRISHAYLFTGPRGTGKTSTARILARAINCQNLKEGSPCNACEICKAALEERLTDLIEIDAASHGLVDDARALVEQAKFMPVQATKKIYIIDEVHMLSKSAFNALLKIIEEPPDHVHFILATTEARKVLETIQSRCQRFDFHLADQKLIVSHLSQVCQWEKVFPEDLALDLIAEQGRGSFRDALSLLSQLIGFGNFTLAQVEETLGLSKEAAARSFLDALQQGEKEKTLHIIHQQYDEGHDLYSFCQGILGALRKMLLASQNADKERRVLAWVEIFFEALDYLRDPLIPELPLEIAVIKAMAVGNDQKREMPAASEACPEPVERVGVINVQNKEMPKKQETPSVQIPATNRQKPIINFVESIGHPPLRRLLKCSSLVMSGNELKIAASSQIELQKLKSHENQEMLHEQLRAMFGSEAYLSLSVTEKPPNPGLSKEDVSAVFLSSRPG